MTSESAVNVIGVHENGNRPARPGYDHSWFSWSTLPDRPQVHWPGGASVAISVVVDLGAVEWELDGPGPVPPVGGRGAGPHPDVPRMSHREFGHRVGIFRLAEMLAEHDIPLVVATDVLTVEHYPSLVERLRPQVREWIASGLSASRPLSSLMTADEERHYIRTTLERFENGLGMRPKGWLSPERSESFRTPGLLAEAGLAYVGDFGNDELPYPLDAAAAPLWSFPMSWELADVAAMFHRQVTPQAYANSLLEAIDTLCSDSGRGTGRMLALQLSPWLSGQAFRADALELVLRRLAEDSRVWHAPPSHIIDHCGGAR
jgi:allantoinase